MHYYSWRLGCAAYVRNSLVSDGKRQNTFAAAFRRPARRKDFASAHELGHGCGHHVAIECQSCGQAQHAVVSQIAFLRASSRSSRFCFRTVCSFIIVNELAERLAYYGLQASLVLFLTRELKFATGEKRKLRDRSRLNSLSWSQLRRTCKRRSLTACATLHHCWGHGESAYQAVASRSADRSFLVGRLADSTLGRYRAIGVFITIYFVGMVLVSISARPSITCVCVYL